ncbi:hypothetical protein NliqN6_0870 [Naganishia liquefaciens]|uniref:Adenine DNA glycosylase n=1 Tax=Naganishia liquefaciens TaxID=104408 RepID=A0A8H3TPC2_9TREE|nr:hypothetical protein NliqN6_0870 [Naganishia liquefaciens]
MRTPNADKLNVAMRTSLRKRKFTTTVILSDSDDHVDDNIDGEYKAAVFVVDSPDEYDDKKSDESEEDLKSKAQRRRKSPSTKPKPAIKRVKSCPTSQDPSSIEDVVSDWRPHSKAYHDADRIMALQDDLLQWFETVREKRAMPWRKVYNGDLAMTEKGQRAYEIWVSEVMLQQTQVTTVIPYWKKWMTTWPTIADLAQADVEQVNSAWKGLGYYRRARSLLAGAQRVMSDPKYKGRLPDVPAVMEKEIEGVGRYTAGAICSMAYGVRTPIVDGNIHRLLCRLLALHAPATSPALLKKLWTTAQALVDNLPADGAQPGDLNQALMELGSQICKPSNPDCGSCPLRTGCNAFAELSMKPTPPQNETTRCDVCVSAAGDSISVAAEPAVTIYPMKKQAKAPREQSTAVCLVEWNGQSRQTGDKKWLLVKRPDKGLLAGLLEPPSIIIDAGLDTKERRSRLCSHVVGLLEPTTRPESSMDVVRDINRYSYLHDYVHVFSHIRMTYHVHRLCIDAPEPPALCSGETETTWLGMDEIAMANITTGTKNIIKELYDPPQLRDTRQKKAGTTRKPRAKAVPAVTGEKIVKIIKMPGT